MRSLSLDIHGVRVRAHSPEPEIIDFLRRDFEYFARENAAPDAAAIELCFLAEKPEKPSGLPTFRSKNFSVHDLDAVRRIDFNGEASAVYDYGARKGAIRCPDLDRLKELAYLALLSRAGEALDQRGLHRVHALGFEQAGRAGLLLLPSGGGKSTLALELLRRSDFGLFSDDTPLVDGLRLRAFPLRLGLLPGADFSAIPGQSIRDFHRRIHGLKKVVDYSFFQDRVRDDLPLEWILIGRRSSSGEPRIAPASRVDALAALAANMVVGIGIAQMTEYTVRFSVPALGNLARIAASRSRAAFRLAFGVPAYRFTLGPDVAANVRALQVLTTQQRLPILKCDGRAASQVERG